jgi:ribosomal protein L21E
MHTGRFKLEKDTLAMGDVNGKRVVVRIPAGDIVEMVARPSVGNRMVEVRWQGRTVAMYAIDLKKRGIETRKAA